MDKLKPCPKQNTFCHIEIIKTAAKPPRNIRIGCELHSFWLPESFESVEEAVDAWNRRARDGR